MKKSAISAAMLALSLGAAGTAGAVPMHPGQVNPPGSFSAYVKSRFHLLADSDNVKLVYYVPKYGNVAVQSPQSTQPVPRFSIAAYTPTSGFWAFKELSMVGGTLSTTGDIGALQTLQNEATWQGLQLAPAPVSKARTTFMVGAEQLTDGRVDAECIEEEYTVTGPNGQPVTYKIPVCQVRKPDGTYVPANVMYKFTSIAAAANGTVNQDISFQAATLPDWSPFMRNLMNSGSSWESVLLADVEWEIKTATLTRQARLTVNWQSLFEQASAFAAFHLNSCVDIEISAFFQRVATCQGGTGPCGVFVEYRKTDGTWTSVPPNDSNFLSVVNALETTLRNELFASIRPVNGPVSTQASAIFTLRANYEKMLTNRNEVYYVNYNQGPAPINLSTNLSINCLWGGYETGPVFWNMENAGCRAILGQP
ncbi:hypothetical protein [Archangium lansingense]|uniref:Uncharacterized protein n=1 Tax=Archangium lansingense TaxID=2995310 RepID=A0ABT4APD7_9BACT|nr:hypothetical protein [Archangium lansinium]MCY1083136.1 hypothetical protein [Archangium lansinium]